MVLKQTATTSGSPLTSMPIFDDGTTTPARNPPGSDQCGEEEIEEFIKYQKYKAMREKYLEKRLVDIISKEDIALRNKKKTHEKTTKRSGRYTITSESTYEEGLRKRRDGRRGGRGSPSYDSEILKKKNGSETPTTGVAEEKEGERREKPGDDINECPVSRGLKGPRVKMYTGVGDPDDHIANFRWAIKMILMDPRLWSLYVAGTLDGSAQYWIESLPPKSINSFEELREKFCSSFIQERKFQQQSHAIFGCIQRKGETNKDYFRRFNEISRHMPIRDDHMIIAAFTYGLRGWELFKLLVDRKWRNAEEMIEIVNRFLRQESKNAEKLRSEGRAPDGEERTAKSYRKHFHHGTRNEGKGRTGGAYPGFFPKNIDKPYRHEAHVVNTPKGPHKTLPYDKWQYPRDPNQYCDFHQKMGHSTATCESRKREEAKGRTEGEGICDDPVPNNYVGTEPFIISGAIGRTKVHRMYVDGGSFVNIIYEHCLAKLPTEVKGIVKPVSIHTTVIGFAGHPVRPECKINLLLMLEDYAENRKKTVLAEFIIIKPTSAALRAEPHSAANRKAGRKRGEPNSRRKYNNGDSLDKRVMLRNSSARFGLMSASEINCSFGWLLPSDTSFGWLYCLGPHPASDPASRVHPPEKSTQTTPPAPQPISFQPAPQPAFLIHPESTGLLFSRVAPQAYFRAFQQLRISNPSSAVKFSAMRFHQSYVFEHFFSNINQTTFEFGLFTHSDSTSWMFHTSRRSSVTTRVGPTPKARHRKVRVSPTTCLRGIVQGDMVGVYWAARPYDAGPSEVRSQVRVSPTTCLRGIVQGDMVGVYWAARPYDAGPSEVRSQVRVSPTTCLRGIVQGDMVGVYWAARPYDAGPSDLDKCVMLRNSSARFGLNVCFENQLQLRIAACFVHQLRMALLPRTSSCFGSRLPRPSSGEINPDHPTRSATYLLPTRSATRLPHPSRTTFEFGLFTHSDSTFWMFHTSRRSSVQATPSSVKGEFHYCGTDSSSSVAHDMTGVSRRIGEHRLNINPDYPPVKQKKRLMVRERNEIKVEALGGYKWKSFLDAYKGYHQIKMEEEDEDRTAFHTERGTFCYTKMPFGLRNVGATYHIIMDKVFEKQIGRNVEAYVDDMVIKSRSDEEFLRDIEEVLTKLR
ncbi:hypothetical protein LXL04_016473 [Taraxacum kok-saghyz]